MNKIDHMIFVFTCPRSYSSLLTKCIHACDAFVGDCSKNEIRNHLGHYENNAIFVTCFRKYVNQHDNSAYRAFMEDEYLKDKFNLLNETMTSIFNYQGYTGGAAIFKHTVYQMNYKNILNKFDKDKISIVVPKRSSEQVLDSYKKLCPKKDVQYIENEIIAYRQNINNIINDYPEITTVIDTNKLYNKDYNELSSFIKSTPFLQWDKNSVDKCIDYKIKSKKGKFGLATIYGEQ